MSPEKLLVIATDERQPEIVVPGSFTSPTSPDVKCLSVVMLPHVWRLEIAAPATYANGAAESTPGRFEFNVSR